MKAPWTDRVSDGIDHVAKVLSPRWYAGRIQEKARAKLAAEVVRFGYDAIQTTRLQSKRSGLTGSGDQQLTEPALTRLRNICRDLGRNNSLVKGILVSEADDVVGTQTIIQARTRSKAWNQKVEALFKEEMIDQPCEITGRFNLHKVLHTAYLSYRRDGDIFLLNSKAGLEVCEGEQCGTPWGKLDGQRFRITNGVATNKKSGRVIGYYLGKRNRWGYIAADGWRPYTADVVHHVFNPERFSYTRGEPALTSTVGLIDEFARYRQAELVAAHVNACLSVFVTHEDELNIPVPYTQGIHPSGETATGSKVQKIEPGEIHHLGKGESINTVVPRRPPTAFKDFSQQCLMEIGRCLPMPLMLVTLDFSGATYMNARIAYKSVQRAYRREQAQVVIPMASRIWRWWLTRALRDGKLRERSDAFAHEVTCQRWPYVDPYREAQADKLELDNKTTSRSQICARKGLDYRDVVAERQREREVEAEAGEAAVPAPPKEPAEKERR